MTEYIFKTYDTMRLHVTEGMYSIAEMEEMLADMKEAKKRQDEHLNLSMQPLKEKSNA
jgi:hypothetical protein